MLAVLPAPACRSRKDAPGTRANASVEPASRPVASAVASAAFAGDGCGVTSEREHALRALGAISTRIPLSDYGHGRTTSTCYFAISPKDPAAVAGLIRTAKDLRIPVRIRARAHSANGSTLPAQGEIVLLTSRLDTLSFDEPGTVDVGAGIPIQRVDAALRKHGFSLPVMNDGASGPSVGGYISAAGMGSGSREHGGFWENVRAIRVVSGTGELLELEAAHPDFLWLFGAMGQLGVIVQARLAILPIGEAPEYPLGHKRRIDPGSDEPEKLLQKGPNEQERLRWFTLLTKPDRKLEARRELERIVERHATALAFRPLYEYAFKTKRDVPPLFFDQGRELVALGVWGDILPGTSQQATDALERDFMDLVRTKGFRRYIQSETPATPRVYESYFGPALYGKFRALKARYDPEHLINRGSVFSLLGGPDPREMTPRQ
jgi:FAD/FMN-containing dehydrogenase